MEYDEDNNSDNDISADETKRNTYFGGPVDGAAVDLDFVFLEPGLEPVLTGN